MNYFFGFDNKLANNIDWFFNTNHLFLILFVALVVISSLFIFSAKSEKGKKITKIAIACILFVLEVQVFNACSQWWKCRKLQLVVEYFFPNVCNYDLDNDCNFDFERLSQER